MQVLIVEPPVSALPDGTIELVASSGWGVTTATDYADALEAARTGSIDAVIMSGPTAAGPGSDQTPDFSRLMRIVDAQRIAAIVIDDPDGSFQPDNGSLVEVLGRDTPLAELRGRLAMIERYHGHLNRMERELGNMERLGKRLNEHFREVDQEMRLAGRLQRDFLPQLDQPIGNVRFANIFRPASWVSGDMFDVFRIDEDYTGFYVADAVGHGMAASLLTMFIKRAIISKEVDGDSYRVLSPSETMAILNAALTDQSLPNCQFVTACYGTINHKTLALQYARGGHPYPMLLAKDGFVTDLKTTGGLLGIFKEEEFPTFETQLHPGDKVLLYTDGVELAFPTDGNNPPDARVFRDLIDSLAHMPIDKLLREVEKQLDGQEGSLNPRDDVTIVSFEVIDQPQP